MELERIPAEFFDRPPQEVARDLLGQVLVSRSPEGLTAGVIVEAEAYLGPEDPGSHAATRGITGRNEVMYRAPATVYVYFSYGMHHMLNIVCGPVGVAGAVLIRALRPTVGLDIMSRRRGMSRECELCSGPGKLVRALGVDLSDNGSLLGEGRLAVCRGEAVAEQDVEITRRIGLSAGADLELRYSVRGDACVSNAKTRPLRPSGATKGQRPSR